MHWYVKNAEAGFHAPAGTACLTSHGAVRAGEKGMGRSGSKLHYEGSSFHRVRLVLIHSASRVHVRVSAAWRHGARFRCWVLPRWDGMGSVLKWGFLWLVTVTVAVCAGDSQLHAAGR